MAFAVSALSLFLVVVCVFVPIFGIALAMLKSARRAFSIAAVFALGSVAGVWIAAAFVRQVIGHAAGPEFRDAFSMAFVTGGAVAGGVLATWLLNRKAGLGR